MLMPTRFAPAHRDLRSGICNGLNARQPGKPLLNLTLVAFVIAVVGIVLQLADAFPEHRETRKVIVYLSLGVFVGVAVSALLGATYNVTGDVDRRFALLYGLAAIGGVFGLLAVFSQSDQRQQMAAGMAFASAGLFLVTGFAVALGSGDRVPRYSTDEILLLADSAEQAGQFQTAIDRLQELEARLDSAEAQTKVQRRIDRLQGMQAGGRAQ